MKTLLLLLLLAACGKHEMPSEKDMRDSDGDQLLNEYEKAGMDKFMAGIVPLKEIQMDVEFLLGESVLVKHNRVFSNKIDLQKYSKDLLVRSLEAIRANEYFSEFSYMRIADAKTTQIASGNMIAVKVRPTITEVSPKALLLVNGEQKIELAIWDKQMEFTISSDQLNAVLNGEAHFVATNLNEKKTFFKQTQEASIQEKTYRVLLNDGKKTNIHYISKELSLSDILKYFNIRNYKNIEEQNLLSTTLKTEVSEWWVRQINNRDIIVVKDNVRELANHYLEGFSKVHLQLTRFNGFPQAPVSIKKHAAAKMLLKIRGQKNVVSFSTKTDTRGQRTGGQNHDFWECKDQFRIASPENTINLSETSIMDILALNSKIKGHETLNAGDDEKGRFLEIQMVTESEEIYLNVAGVPNDQYVQEGLYHSKCKGAKDPKIKPNLQVPERSLTVNIEAFVEKI